MKVSTTALFDRAAERMSGLQARLAQSQAQLTASKQVLAPSDAPDKASLIQRLQGEIGRQDSQAATLKTAQARYQAEETAMRSAADVMLRLRELATQAVNDTNGPTDRQAMAVEMRTLRAQLLALANSQDDAGNALFAGTRVRSAAFVEAEDGTVRYAGDQTQVRIPAGLEQTVAYTRAGTDVFARVRRDDGQGGVQGVGFFDALRDLVAAADGNDRAGLQRGLAELGQMQDHLDLALAAAGADQQQVRTQQDVLEQTSLRLKSSLSDVQDLDYTSAITRMNQQVTALQAAMASFAKVAALSLFDHLR